MESRAAIHGRDVALPISHPSGEARRVSALVHRIVSRDGFSLIEMMVALGILAFGILAATASQIGSMKVSAESRNRTVAMNLAEGQMEVFEVMTPAEVLTFTTVPGFEPDASNPIDPDPGDGATMQFNRSWDIRSDTPEAGVMSITVRVSWTDNLGTVRNATIQTLKRDP